KQHLSDVAGQRAADLLWRGNDGVVAGADGDLIEPDWRGIEGSLAGGLAVEQQSDFLLERVRCGLDDMQGAEGARFRQEVPRPAEAAPFDVEPIKTAPAG